MEAMLRDYDGAGLSGYSGCLRTVYTTIFRLYMLLCGSGSSVGRAIDYGLDGPGIESGGGWGRDFPETLLLN
jgi:hypothetical protein